MQREARPPAATGTAGSMGNFDKTHSTPRPLPVQEIIAWVLRQPQTDLNEIAIRRWLPTFSAWTKIHCHVAELRGRLALAEQAEVMMREALDEAAEYIEVTASPTRRAA